jgi:hypothetical protein
MGCAVPVYHGIPTGIVGSVTEGRRVADGKGIAAQGPSTTHSMTPRSAQPMRSYCRCCWLSGPRAAVRLGRSVWSSPRAPWPRDASRPPSFPRASSRGRPAHIRCRCRDEAPGTAKASRTVEAHASTNKAGNRLSSQRSTPKRRAVQADSVRSARQHALSIRFRLRKKHVRNETCNIQHTACSMPTCDVRTTRLEYPFQFDEQEAQEQRACPARANPHDHQVFRLKIILRHRSRTHP